MKIFSEFYSLPKSSMYYQYKSYFSDNFLYRNLIYISGGILAVMVILTQFFPINSYSLPFLILVLAIFLISANFPSKLSDFVFSKERKKKALENLRVDLCKEYNKQKNAYANSYMRLDLLHSACSVGIIRDDIISQTNTIPKEIFNRIHSNSENYFNYVLFPRLHELYSSNLKKDHDILFQLSEKIILFNSVIDSTAKYSGLTIRLEPLNDIVAKAKDSKLLSYIDFTDKEDKNLI